MKKTAFLALLLALTLAAGVCCAEESFLFDPALQVDDAVVSTAELEAAMRLHLIEASLSCASYGYALDAHDAITLLDAMDKVLWDLEYSLVIRAQAQARGVSLTEEDRALAAETARSRWEEALDLVRADEENGFLPPGNYDWDPEDPEGNITRYLESFGFTLSALTEEEEGNLLSERLKEAVTGDMEDADGEARLNAFVDWLLERMDEASIEEDAMAVAEVCLRFAF